MLCVSAVWHSNVLGTMDTMFNPIENNLIEKLGSHFVFRNSFTQSTVCKNGCWKGVRVDRIIQLEIMKGFVGKTIDISYTYSFINDNKNIYRTQYKIDCVPKEKRTMWIHRSENILTGREYTYTMNIAQASEGDILEIAINYYTPRGLINASSVKWESISLIKEVSTNFVTTLGGTTSLKNNQDKDQILREGIDLNRICELETMGSEWFDSKYYKMSKQFYNLDELLQCFIVNSIEFTEFDIKAFKIKLTAYRTGYINRTVVGMPILIKSFDMECKVEAKRLGLMIDRDGYIQLRIGDTLLLYLSKHKHE